MKSHLLRSFKALLLTALMVFIVAFANAATKTWVPTSGGIWTTASNWSPSGVPTTGDDVIIPADQSANITAVPTISLNSLTINGTCVLLQQLVVIE